MGENFAWTVSGNIVYSVSQWAVLAMLARLGDPAMVGVFALGLAVTAPLMMAANLQLRAVIVTDVEQQYLFGHYLALRLALSAIAIVATLLIVSYGRYHFTTFFVIMAIALARAFDAVSDILYGLLQQHEYMERVGKSLLLKGPLTVVAMAIALELFRRVEAAACAFAASSLAILIIYDLRSGIWLRRRSGSRVRLRPVWKLETVWRLAVLAAPLAPVAILASLNSNIPRYIVQAHFGERELGVFAAITYILVAGGSIGLALSQTVAPRLAHYYASGDRAAFIGLLSKSSIAALLLGGAGILVARFGGGTALTLVYGATYRSKSSVLIWVMVAATSLYASLVLDAAINAARQFRIQIPLQFATVLVTLGTSLLFVPRLGLVGGALGIALGFLTHALIALAICIRAIRGFGPAISWKTL